MFCSTLVLDILSIVYDQTYAETAYVLHLLILYMSILTG